MLRVKIAVKSSDKNSAHIATDIPGGKRPKIFRSNDHVSVIYDVYWLWKVVFEPRLHLKVQQAFS
jgi:hypothetical protein